MRVGRAVGMWKGKNASLRLLWFRLGHIPSANR
jgi:hypothetical protein